MAVWTGLKKCVQWLWRHKVISTIGAVVMLLIAAVLTVVVQNVDEGRKVDDSASDPLGFRVEQLLDRDDPPLLLGEAKSTLLEPRGMQFVLVVPDPARLPEPLPPRPFWPPGDDCKALWQIGVDAGGRTPTSGRYKLTFASRYRGGDISITELRARILDRTASSDGAWLKCALGGMGIETDQPFACDLTKSDPAVCTVDGLSPLSEVGRVTMSEGQHEEIQVSVKLPPTDAVEWFLEAKVIVGDREPRWIRLNADSSVGESGEPFRSLGLRDNGPHQRYKEYIWSLALPFPIPGLVDAGWRRGNAEPPVPHP